MSGRPPPLALYAAATGALEPLVPALLRRRAARGKEDPARLGERLGRTAVPRPPGRLAWLHGVSVGESLSLLPLIDALRARRPDLQILATSGTTTAAAVLAKRLPDGVIHQYAPIDAPGAVRRFLDHWRPDLGLQVESELWPNLILVARDRGVRLALVSARMTEESARGWRRAPASARAVLGAFDLVLPQEAATAGRLQALGARLGPPLNLKLVGAAPPADPAEVERLRRELGGRRVVLAASTHAGEEALVLRAFREAELANALLVIAPRHPERAGALASALDEGRGPPPRRSRGEAPDGDVYLADTLGELGLFLRLAEVAVMGGGFVPGVGGHNPLEAARLGVPVISGPHVFNAAAIYDEMSAGGAAIIAPDAAALAGALAAVTGDPARAAAMRRQGLDYAARQGEALDRAMTALEPLFPPCP